MTENLLYKAPEIAKKIGYKSTICFVTAAKLATEEKNPLVKKLWDLKLPAKVCRSFVFPKTKVDQVLREFGLIE